eukprot:2441162-Prorocentrum_lima.AAC.1
MSTQRKTLIWDPGSTISTRRNIDLLRSWTECMRLALLLDVRTCYDANHHVISLVMYRERIAVPSRGLT